MPEKKRKETPGEQSARFRAEVRRMVDAGELGLTEADERFERAVRAVANSKQIGSIADAD
jgi:hypothetical protein